MIKYFFIILALITVFIVIDKLTGNGVAYNKHMCAVYGYKEDCKTPLPASERLK